MDIEEKGCVGEVGEGGGKRDGGRDAICEQRIQKEKITIWNINKSENERKVSGGKKTAALRRMACDLRLHPKMNQISYCGLEFNNLFDYFCLNLISSFRIYFHPSK